MTRPTFKRKQLQPLLMWICSLALILAASACAQSRIALEESVVQEYFPFIRDGRTTEAKVVERLGEARRSYENGRIITYLFSADRNNQLHVVETIRGERDGVAVYNLVLVIGPDGVLERHSVVRVN